MHWKCYDFHRCVGLGNTLCYCIQSKVFKFFISNWEGTELAIMLYFPTPGSFKSQFVNMTEYETSHFIITGRDIGE